MAQEDWRQVMYGFYGGCTSLFHLAVRYPIIVLAVALGGFVHEVNTQAPGNMSGTDSVLEQVQSQLVKQNPSLSKNVDMLKDDFAMFEAQPTEDQVRKVLSFTDACTDATVKDVLSNPDRRREAAWLLYLDTYSREGPTSANKLFAKNKPIARLLKE